MLIFVGIFLFLHEIYWNLLVPKDINVKYVDKRLSPKGLKINIRPTSLLNIIKKCRFYNFSLQKKTIILTHQT